MVRFACSSLTARLAKENTNSSRPGLQALAAGARSAARHRGYIDGMKRFRWFLAAAFSLAVCASQASASSTYNGKIVDYLTAVGLQSGGVITYNPNGGGIST